MQPNVSEAPASSRWRLWAQRGASLFLSVSCTAVALDGYSSEVTFRWDYSESGANGFALYCGVSTRGYSTRIDAGNTDVFTLPLSEAVVQFCSVRAYDPAGEESVFSNEVAVSVDEITGAVAVLPPMTIAEDAGITLTATGFRAAFSLPFDRRWLNLFGSEQGGEGPADVTLVGATTGPVRGSLILDEDSRGFTFVKTGGVLAPDTYTLNIVSRSDSVIDAFGRPIDGDRDGMFGDDYRFSFVVPPGNVPIISIGEFARGPGQIVNLPASNPGAGIPVRISNGAAVREVAFTLRYNPALLSVEDVTLSNSVSGILVPALIDPVAGLAQIRVSNLSGLTDASTVLLRLQAGVPLAAPYGRQHLLDITDLELNAGALSGLDDDGLHVVAKLGDATGEGIYTSLDAQRIQRVVLQLDSGFSAYPLTDPVVVGDVNGSGRLESTDAQLVSSKVLRRAVPEIPD